MPRNGEHELKYFSSDLNKFIHTDCRKTLTINNIDCIMFKRQYREVKIIEYKHLNENGKDTQPELLRLLSKFQPPKNYNFLGVFLVRGNEPFDYVEIEKFGTNEKWIIQDQKTFKRWLEFEYDLE